MKSWCTAGKRLFGKLISLLFQLFSVIVFGCISNKGWNEDGPKPVCIFNKDGNACRIGNLVGVVGFIGALVLLVLEALFQNLSSIKVRKRAVAVDIGFSAAWAILYLIAFAYLGIAWGRSDYPRFGEGINNARSAVAFSFFSIPVWAGCAYFAWQRWQTGADMSQFASGFEGQVPPGAEYSAYPVGQTDPNAMYAVDDYTQQQQQPGMDANPFAAGNAYQAPAY